MGHMREGVCSICVSVSVSTPELWSPVSWLSMCSTPLWSVRTCPDMICWPGSMAAYSHRLERLRRWEQEQLTVSSWIFSFQEPYHLKESSTIQNRKLTP